ncbi:MAG: hypothetical protein CMQ24_13950 [Gammaproteobacteria bacterium]|nr:hypothetical protein [Gammaproteobacteria bacterium]
MPTTTVLELGGPAAGYVGKLYRRWGAEVCRIDDPEDPHTAGPEYAAVDLYLHAGKRRLLADLASDGAPALLARLAERADVIVADLPPSRLDTLGWSKLGGTACIRTAITPFGMNGPRRDWHGSSNVLLALGGETFIMGDPGRAPLTIPGRYLHYQAGQYAYAASVACRRQTPDSVRDVDVSVYETAQSLHQFTTVMWTHNDTVRARHGNDFGVLHPITMYPCKDGWWATNADVIFWDAFTVMLGRPDLADDPRFNTVAGRVTNAKALDQLVMEELGDKTRAELMELGQVTCRVPTGILNTLDELLEDPHLRERNFWQPMAAGGRTLKMAGSAFTFMGEGQPAQPAPIPAASAEEVLDD